MPDTDRSPGRSIGCGCAAAVVVWMATGILVEPLGVVFGVVTGAIAYVVVSRALAQRPRE